MKYAPSFALAALAAALMACSSEPGASAERGSGASMEVAPGVRASASDAAQSSPPAGAADRTLQLSGLGGLRIGVAVPTGGGWASAGGEAGAGCRAVRSADFPGVYALVEGGAVRRITVGQGSDVKLMEGVGVGATEADVRQRFAGFRSEPHKYEDPPAKYLTAPNASETASALRFEIGADGKVAAMHVGFMPQLAYVEGCG